MNGMYAFLHVGVCIYIHVGVAVLLVIMRMLR